MPNIIIVGGGLTGLSAAWELETLGIEYTLIEVKPRLGGSIMTRRENGFSMDATAFVIEKYGAWDFLEPLGLPDALRYVGRYRDGRLVVFKDGTQTLVDALAARITHPIMHRMAVSSVGRLDADHYGVCLENGLMLDASALILTPPARYIGHMLYSLDQEAALLLADYQYDPVARVQLGYRKADIRTPLPQPAPPYKYLEAYDFADRVPADHVLIRAGVRVDPANAPPSDALIAQVRDTLSFSAQPVTAWASYWAESDPLTRHLPDFTAILDEVESRLPPTVALAGSDYRAKRLDQQVQHGRAAARKIASALR